jgi:hypothetical protein
VKEREEKCLLYESLKETRVAKPCLLSGTYRRWGLTSCIAFTSHDIGDAGSKIVSSITGDIGDTDCNAGSETESPFTRHIGDTFPEPTSPIVRETRLVYPLSYVAT